MLRARISREQGTSEIFESRHDSASIPASLREFTWLDWPTCRWEEAAKPTGRISAHERRLL
jgi:hypothetical protein